MNDHQYMHQVLDLAKKGAGSTSPNPMVGAIIAKDDQIIAKGYHQKFGSDHAEKDALKRATEDVSGATLYCNLEPCCHTNKKTPPCVPVIIKSGIKKVVIANTDPNPSVSGQGIAQLKAAGIDVITGVMEKEGRQLNEIFFHYITTGLPFIHLKMAQTLDGKIADNTGTSQWISNEHSRKRTHELRHLCDAILVGGETVRKDNPFLTVRDRDHIFRQPQKIIVTSQQFFDSSLKIYQGEKPWLVNLPTREDWLDFFKTAAKKNISSILVEGGSQIHSQLIKYNLWDRLTTFIAPKLLGNGVNIFHDKARPLSESIQLSNLCVEQLADNVLLSGTRK